MTRIVLLVAALACERSVRGDVAYTVSAESGVLTSTQPGGSAY